MTYARTLLYCLGLAAGLPATLLAQESVIDPRCELYEAKVHGKFQGTLAKLSFPGPPNYSSFSAGDAREDVIALVLPTEVCWAFENHVFHTLGMQLVLTTTQAEVARRHLNGEVVVYGETFEAETGHHHTGMLISVDSLVVVPVVSKRQ